MTHLNTSCAVLAGRHDGDDETLWAVTHEDAEGGAGTQHTAGMASRGTVRSGAASLDTAGAEGRVAGTAKRVRVWRGMAGGERQGIAASVSVGLGNASFGWTGVS